MATAFTLLNNQLIKAGVKAQQGQISGGNWMKIVSRAYKALSPTELATLQKSASAVERPFLNATKAEKNLLAVGTKSGLPLRVESHAEAMGLPMEKVLQMFPQIAPQRKVSTRLYTIAARLKIKPPTREVIKKRLNRLLVEKRTIRDRARTVQQQHMKRTSKDRSAISVILKKVQSQTTVKLGVAKKLTGDKTVKKANAKKVKKVAKKSASTTTKKATVA